MTDEAQDAVIREFITSVEEVKKEQIRFVLSSAPTLRSHAKMLTLTECFAAHTYELNTFQRTSVLDRLRQRAGQRASELVQSYLEKLEGEEIDG